MIRAAALFLFALAIYVPGASTANAADYDVANAQCASRVFDPTVHENKLTGSLIATQVAYWAQGYLHGSGLKMLQTLSASQAADLLKGACTKYPAATFRTALGHLIKTAKQ